MKASEKFQRIRDYIDSQNILDYLMDFLSDDELNELCEGLEDEFEISYDEFDNYSEDEY